MLVHSFSQDSRWREDFAAFAGTIGGNRVTDDLYEIELSERPRLIIGWCKGAEKYLAVEMLDLSLNPLTNIPLCSDLAFQDKYSNNPSPNGLSNSHSTFIGFSPLWCKYFNSPQ